MVAAVRLREIERHDDEVEVEWRAFLLRPEPALPPRTLEQFRAYTESWRRAAAEEPSAEFSVWRTDEGPPSHSVPPHRVAKAAAELGREQFQRMHELLLRSYFVDNLDITSRSRLLELWQQADLPADEVDRWESRRLLEQIVTEHREAIEHGAGGVPAVRIDGSFGVVTGAQPIEAYRDWIERARSAAATSV